MTIGVGSLQAVVFCFETGITTNRLSQAEGSSATDFITDLTDLTDGCSGKRKIFPTRTLEHSPTPPSQAICLPAHKPLTKKSNILV
ncbi:hypothetical protein QUB60_13020 [Microcoleus sp. A2-C5]|uniref:hypothetical protein n=1 Tax=unclassified Microcoleus TaxID=2642155 RepID=UPI002FD397F9